MTALAEWTEPRGKCTAILHPPYAGMDADQVLEKVKALVQLAGVLT